MSRTDLWFASLLLPEGWADDVRLTVIEGRVASVTQGTAAVPTDERHEIGLPGLPNLHSHAFQRGMAGLTERRGPSEDSFWTWREAMYRFVDRMEPDDVEAIAAQAFLEMLEGGFTRVGEFHYLHHAPTGAAYDDIAELAGRIAAAASATGIALTLLPVFYAHAGFGGQPAAPGQRRFVNDVERYGRLIEASRRAVSSLPDAVLGIAPHSLRAATPAEITTILPLAAGGPIHIHIAEQTKEVDDCLAWSGLRPVELLLDHAPVDARWCLVHATHMNDAEYEYAAQSGAVAGLCPTTEANLGDGIFDFAKWRGYGGAWGVGSDSHASVNAAEELLMLEYSQRLGKRQRNVGASAAQPHVATALTLEAVQGGARASGRAVGGLAVGQQADFVVLDASHLALQGLSAPDMLSAHVFASHRTSAIDAVWVAGEVRVAAGRHALHTDAAAAFVAARTQLLKD